MSEMKFVPAGGATQEGQLCCRPSNLGGQDDPEVGMELDSMLLYTMGVVGVRK